jgi:hypothetical protein
MRKIDLERSRDSYKETLNAALHCLTEMTAAFERRDKSQIARINELEAKIKELKGVPHAD